jgi:hypothetical protein
LSYPGFVIDDHAAVAEVDGLAIALDGPDTGAVVRMSDFDNLAVAKGGFDAMLAFGGAFWPVHAKDGGENARNGRAQDHGLCCRELFECAYVLIHF